MRKIKISRFGPLNNIDLTLSSSIDIVIGAQATGKSTLAKTIYFCRKIRDHLISFLLNSTNFLTHPNELYMSFLKYTRKLFMGCFGTTKHLSGFNIKYYYNFETSTHVNISLRYDGYTKIEFSDDLKSGIGRLIDEAQIINEQLKKNKGGSFLERYNEEAQLQSMYRRHFTEEAQKLFYDDSDIIYIPAGRSVLSTFSEQLYDVDVSNMDSTMQDFINLIRSVRNRFNMPLDDFVKNYTRTVKGQINNVSVQYAMQIIAKILKGNYVCDRDGEKIFFNADKWVKLMFASSGQQESLWTLMLMFDYVLENRKAFIVLEEPEAHLFPEAQKNMVELIALFCNSTGSASFVTTHSPYILTSFNLLVHSFKVENNIRISSEERVVVKNCRVDPMMLACNMLNNADGQNLRSIKDADTGMIDAFEIDSVSEIINGETSRLLELETKYGL